MIRRGWTVYAALLTAAIVVGEARNVAHGVVDARSLANWVLTFVLLLATWGYALQRPIGAPCYWRAACWVVLLASLVTIIPAALAGPAAVIMVAVLMPLVVPAFVASFLYAYCSPQVWRTDSHSP